tara:strand:+ start:204 stop:584 length:381 start_codon:yes stop_codon:yes gene_type:complete
MGHRIHFYSLDGGKPTSVYGNRPHDLLIESFAEDAMPLGWVKDEDAPYDRAFEDQCDRYSLVEMYHSDNTIDVVTLDGKPVGVLDEPVPANFDEYETLEQIELREGADDAARELHADAARKLRAAE